jgi:hypothetical protein
MPVAVLVEAEEVTVENYDAVREKLGEEPPDGVLVQTAGPMESGGLRVFSVWESREHYDRFREDRLLPALREAIGEEAAAGPSGAEIYELHDIFIKPESS